MTDLLEVRERQEQAAEADRFSGRVSILVALLAVITAATSSFENTETAGAITAQGRAVLAQDKATDQWNFYEAKSLKKNMLEIAAGGAGPRGPGLSAKAAKEAADQASAEAKARSFEKERDAALEESELHEKRHHRLSLAATLLEIGIAISTIAIITRRHWPWILSACLGLGGLVTAATAFL